MRLADLATRYDLAPDTVDRLARLADLLVRDPLAPTAIKSEQEVLDRHLADSLVALECDLVPSARAALDLGSGAGLPGVPLAIALPTTAFTLLESSSRKCRFLERAAEVCGVTNAEVVHSRAESFDAGRDRYDLVTVRAVAALAVIAEYAAPLLHVGGHLVAWQGRRDTAAEAALGHAAVELGLGAVSVSPVSPYPGAEHRHLYAVAKVRATPPRFPRRPGMAVKRPLGAEVLGGQSPSDRVQR